MPERSFIVFAALLSFCFAALPAKSQTQPPEIKVDSIAPGFWVYRSYGDYNGRRVSANGLLYQSASGLVIVDTPWDIPQTKQLLNWIDSNIHKPILYSIHTHYHADRIGGLDAFHERGIKSYATAATIAKVPAKARTELTAINNTDTVLYASTTPIEVYFPGAGHTADNIVVWFPLQKLLFGGCLVKSTDDTTLGNLADADLQQWPATMQNLLKRYKDARIIIPGHDGWADKNSLQHTLDMLNQGKTQ